MDCIPTFLHKSKASYNGLPSAINVVETVIPQQNTSSVPEEMFFQRLDGSTPTLSRHTEQSIGRVLYVDQAALSQYPKRDNYLLFDTFDVNTGGFFLIQ